MYLRERTVIQSRCTGRGREEEVWTVMHIDVIEFELTCAAHGVHRTIVPAVLPWPKNCAHCFLPLAARRELRRFQMEGPLPSAVGGEAWIG